MTIGMRNRQELERMEPRPAIEPPTSEQRIGGYVIGVLIVLIIIGLVVDAFLRPAYWIGMR